MEVRTVVDETVHPTTVGVKLRPEATDIPLVVRSARFRVVPVQGVGDKIGGLKRSGGPGIGEQWHICKIPQPT